MNLKNLFQDKDEVVEVLDMTLKNGPKFRQILNNREALKFVIAKKRQKENKDSLICVQNAYVSKKLFGAAVRKVEQKFFQQDLDKFGDSFYFEFEDASDDLISHEEIVKWALRFKIQGDYDESEQDKRLKAASDLLYEILHDMDNLMIEKELGNFALMYAIESSTVKYKMQNLENKREYKERYGGYTDQSMSLFEAVESKLNLMRSNITPADLQEFIWTNDDILITDSRGNKPVDDAYKIDKTLLYRLEEIHRENMM